MIVPRPHAPGANQKPALEEGLTRARDPRLDHDSLPPARLRPLPPPFRNFLSITSDCDSPHLERWLRVGAVIREEHGLPVADSLFVNWMTRRGERNRIETTGVTRGLPAFDRGLFVEKMGPLLRRFHRGWFDTIHGWLQRFTIRIADGFRLENRAPPRRSFWMRARRKIFRVHHTGGRSRRRVAFVAPPSWQQHEPPRYLLFRYAMPVADSRLRIVGFAGEERLFELDSSTFSPEKRFVPLPVLIDLFPLMGNDPEKLLALELEFQLFSTTPGAFVQVEEPTLVSEIREDVRRQMEIQTAFHLGMSAFSSHGIGMVFGARNVNDLSSTDTRWLADDPRNQSYYFKDLLDEAGVEFFNSFNNTTQESALRLEEILAPAVFNDGSVSYDFHRYIHWIRNAQGELDPSPFRIEGEPVNPSDADFLGFHLRGALERCRKEEFSGALVYTHAGVRSPRSLEVEEARTGRKADRFDSLNRDTREALAELSNRYYDLDGHTRAEERVWVAPTSSVLRLAQARRGIHEHAVYDETADTVHIETWFDPVTRRPVPNPATGLADLRWLTFYVKDAATARVRVDGELVSHLIRNDGAGDDHPSVTIADVRCPTVILDEVDLHRKGTVDGDSGQLVQGESFRGERAARVRGTLRYRPHAPVEISGHHSFRFAYRKRSRDTSFSLRLELGGGMIWRIRERGAAAPDPGLEIPPRSDEKWHDVVLPFWQLLRALPPRDRRVPSTFHAFELEADGEILLDAVEFLRDRDGPAPADGAHLVGGRVRPSDGLRLVTLRGNGIAEEAVPTPSGYFVFESRVPHGASVSIEGERPDGSAVRPRRGDLHEIHRDDLDFDFELGEEGSPADRSSGSPTPESSPRKKGA